MKAQTNLLQTIIFSAWMKRRIFTIPTFFFASTSKTREVGNRIWPRVFTRFSPTKWCIIWPHLVHEILLLRNFVILLAKQRRNFKESTCKKIFLHFIYCLPNKIKRSQHAGAYSFGFFIHHFCCLQFCKFGHFDSNSMSYDNLYCQ